MQPELEIAYANRFLRSSEEVRKFDEALGRYAKSPVIDDLEDLFSIFDDRTEKQEVMFGLVHLIESFPPEPSFRALVALLPRLAEHARSWSETLIWRILNDDQTRPAFIEVLRAAPEENQTVAIHVLQKAAASTRPRLQKLRDRALSVLSALGRAES